MTRSMVIGRMLRGSMTVGWGRERLLQLLSRQAGIECESRMLVTSVEILYDSETRTFIFEVKSIHLEERLEEMDCEFPTEQ
jgi:hypothetical protein